MAELTLLIIVIGAIWAFWGNLVCWFKGISYREYLDEEIHALESAATTMRVRKPVPLWLNWAGFGLGIVSLWIADPNGERYLIAITVGILAMLLNGILLTLRLLRSNVDQ